MRIYRPLRCYCDIRIRHSLRDSLIPARKSVTLSGRIGGSDDLSTVVGSDRIYLAAALGIEKDSVRVYLPVTVYGHVLIGHYFRNVTLPADEGISFPYRRFNSVYRLSGHYPLS